MQCKGRPTVQITIKRDKHGRASHTSLSTATNRGTSPSARTGSNIAAPNAICPIAKPLPNCFPATSKRPSKDPLTSKPACKRGLMTWKSPCWKKSPNNKQTA
ncbi:hypothetical protein HMPREF9080_01443 [Cardiobacterium valvarum F0432]|uniref:Uncharacterized protein n=1 Tax=Cardiobacterium valvarum F0432 TaxID=797473 RepID=G9ZF98_9GAMM|nr:hypothetical protein HMPREF9080_01443 [Cardiobacterium valvarum F0432]